MELNDFGPVAGSVAVVLAVATWFQKLRPDREDRIVVRAGELGHGAFEAWQMEKARADRLQALADNLQAKLADCKQEAARMREEIR